MLTIASTCSMVSLLLCSHRPTANQCTCKRHMHPLHGPYAGWNSTDYVSDDGSGNLLPTPTDDSPDEIRDANGHGDWTEQADSYYHSSRAATTNAQAAAAAAVNSRASTKRPAPVPPSVEQLQEKVSDLETLVLKAGSQSLLSQGALGVDHPALQARARPVLASATKYVSFRSPSCSTTISTYGFTLAIRKAITLICRRKTPYKTLKDPYSEASHSRPNTLGQAMVLACYSSLRSCQSSCATY